MTHIYAFYSFKDGTVLTLLDVGLSSEEVSKLEELHGKCIRLLVDSGTKVIRMTCVYSFEDGTVLTLFNLSLSSREILKLEELHNDCKRMQIDIK